MSENNNDIESVPYYFFEGEIFRMERIISRLIFAMVTETLMFIAYIILK